MGSPPYTDKCLAAEFVKFPPDFPIDVGIAGVTALDFLGVRWATPETFEAWAEVPVSELWHWCALVSFLDPSTIPVDTATKRWVYEMTAVRLFQDRVVMVSKVIECSWGLDPVSRAVAVKRSMVRMDGFRDWALRGDHPPCRRTSPNRLTGSGLRSGGHQPSRARTSGMPT